mmetsp:Transcript_16508/g.52611  ORF Transcript_16508/g.52611 Transcript_16508/m.52611 type:complete len:282 (+) Transcript_16508:94-939(+)
MVVEYPRAWAAGPGRQGLQPPNARLVLLENRSRPGGKRATPSSSGHGKQVLAKAGHNPQVVRAWLVLQAHRHHERVGDVLRALVGLERESVALEHSRGEELSFVLGQLHPEAVARPRLEHRHLKHRLVHGRAGRVGRGEPPLRAELERVLVSRRISAHGVGRKDELDAGGDDRAIGERDVLESGLDVLRDRGVQAERLEQHPVQVRHILLVDVFDCGLGAGPQLAQHLFRSLLLDLGVLRELVEHPCERAGRGVAAGEDEVEDDVLQLLVGEVLLALEKVG